MWGTGSEEAIEEAQTALRLDPQYVEGPYLDMLAHAYFGAERYEETVDEYKRNAARGGPSSTPFIRWAAACALAGRIDEAQEMVREVLRERPGFTLSQVRRVDARLKEAEYDRVIYGLRKAGLPE